MKTPDHLLSLIGVLPGPRIVDSPGTPTSFFVRTWTATSTIAIERTGILRSVELRRRPRGTTRSLFSSIILVRAPWSFRVAVSTLSRVVVAISLLAMGLRSRQEILLLSWNSLDRRSSPNRWRWSSWIIIVISDYPAAARRFQHSFTALLKFGTRTHTPCIIVGTTGVYKILKKYKELTIFQRSLLLVMRVDTRRGGGERVAGPIAASFHSLLALLVMQRRGATNVSPCHWNEHVQVVDDVARLVQRLGLTDVVHELATRLLLDKIN
jgi:hypothetical protein